MEKNSKIGILKYIASTGAKGVKFEDQPETWYNPSSDEAKEMVKEEYKGKTVEIILSQGKKTEFNSMVLFEAKKEETEVMMSEEKIDEDPKEITEDQKVNVRLGTTKVEEEKVSPEPLPKEEKKTDPVFNYEEQKISFNPGQTAYTKDTFTEMEHTKVETAKKGTMGLTYASWAEVWSKLKGLHPDATYHVHEDEKTGMPYINDEKLLGAFVKVSVKVKEITHTVHLPVMDHSNKSAIGTDLNVVLINKNIQRCFAKAIAMHGIGLYVYKGEDYPEEITK